MEEARIQENKMGVMPVNKLLLNMAVPMMVSMLVQALYNIVDSIFVSMICEEALTAVSLAFPIQALLIAFGTGTGVGVNAILSRSLGCKDKAQAERAAHNGIFLALVSYVVFLLVGIFLSRPFFAAQTDDPLIIQYGVDYLSIVCIFSFGIYAQLIFERVLQACGYTLYTMFTQGVGAIINIIFDPIFIFGWFGLPAMGTAGAAIATVMGQIIAAILALILNKKRNHEVEIHFRRVRPNLRIIGEIYRVGAASILMQAVGSVMYFGMNMILIPFTATASTVWGAFYKLESFILMPIFGLNNGMVPIVAYNYGAGKRSRMVKTIKLSVLYAVILMLIGLAVFQLMPGLLLGMFSPSDNMLEIGIPALRIMSLVYLFAGVDIVCITVFQALGNGFYGLIVSLLRQLGVLLPLAYLFSRLGGLTLVWWALPLAECVALVICMLFFLRIYRTVIRKVPDNP
ncbi:MAG: MATE family efflux transporter [Clostridiales bacterium]|nr:MATE family efflux transporter [Clostridiales bacterium]